MKASKKDLTTDELYAMSLKDLNSLADALANKAMFLKSSKLDETDPERWKRVCLELYHIGEVLDCREENNVLEMHRPKKK